jgi:WD40 repeat protein
MGGVQRSQPPKDLDGRDRSGRRWAGFAAVLVALAAVFTATATVVDKLVEKQPKLWWLWWLWVALVIVAAVATAAAGLLQSDWWHTRQDRQEEEAEAAATAAEQKRLREIELEAHLEAPGRGVARAEWQGWYFTGRTQALRDLVSWLRASNPSDDAHAVQAESVARVVTGEPGSGKSAVLGRLVILSNPSRRAQALQAGVEPGTDPGERSLDTVIHAGGKPTEQILDLIAQAAEVELRAEGLTPRVEELQAALRARGRTGTRPLVVVLDALDEALAPEQLARMVLRPLATGAPDAGIRLLLGTRPRLIRLLGVDAEAVVDLDRPPYVDPGGLERYVRRLLLADSDPTAHTPYKNQPATVVEQVARAVAERAGTTFLIAQLVARTLATKPVVDVRAPGWQDRFPTTVGDAMDGYLARFAGDQTRVHELLFPLAWAYDPGLTNQQVWAQLASTLGTTTTNYTERDVRKLVRDTAAVDLLQRTEQPGGPHAWRLYHEALREHLRTLVDLTDRDVQQHYTNILLDQVRPLPTGAGENQSRNWLRADLYTRTHLATHAAAAGQLDSLLADPGFLLVAEPGRLLRAMPTATSLAALQAARVYRSAAHQLRGRSLGERAAYLGLHAHQTGAVEFARGLRALALEPGPPWSVRWAHWESTNAPQILTGHTGAVRAVAIGTLDGRPIAVTGSDDQTLRIWDLTEAISMGEPLTGHDRPVTAVAVSTLDGRPIAISGSGDRTVRVWDLTDGTPIGKPLTGHTGAIAAVAAGTLEGRAIAVTGSGDEAVRVWDLAEGVAVGEPLTGHTNWVDAVAVGTLDGRTIAVSGGDQTVRVWDLAEGVAVGGPLTGHATWVRAVAIGTLDGRPIAVTGSDDQTVRVWDLTKGSPVGEPLTGHIGPVTAVAIGALNGRPIAVTGSGDRTVRVWDLTDGTPIGKPLTGHSGVVHAVAIGVLNRRPIALSTGGREDMAVRVWDLTEATSIGQSQTGHTGWVYTLAVGVLPDGRPIAVTGSDDRTVRVWDLTDGTPIGKPLTGHTGAITGVAIGALEGLPIAVTGSGDRTVRVWDLTDGTPIGKPLTGHTGSVEAVAISALDGRPIAVSTGGHEDMTVRVWDLTDGIPIGKPLIGHASAVFAVAIGALEGLPIAVTGSHDETVRIWDLADGAPIGEPLTGHTNWVTAVAVGALDGRPIAISGSYDETVRIWDLTDRALKGQPLKGHTSMVFAVAVGALDGRPIAVTGSHDQTVRVWDLTDGSVEVIQVGSPVQAVAPAPLLRSLVVGTEMGVLAIDLAERR